VQFSADKAAYVAAMQSFAAHLKSVDAAARRPDLAHEARHRLTSDKLTELCHLIYDHLSDETFDEIAANMMKYEAQLWAAHPDDLVEYAYPVARTHFEIKHLVQTYYV
jgi:hypothetical protein